MRFCKYGFSGLRLPLKKKGFIQQKKEKEMSKREILIGKIKGKNRMFIHYSYNKYTATDEFVEALKNLLRAEIIMMRKNRPDYADS